MADSLPVRAAGEVIGNLLPGVGAAITGLAGAAARELVANYSDAMKAAVRTSGLSREELDERILEDPELVPLATRLLHLAAVTGRQNKIEMLGAVFGVAIVKSGDREDLESVLAGVDALQVADAAALRLCRDGQTFYPVEGEKSWQGRDMDEVAAQLGTTTERAGTSLGRLAAAGFMRAVSGLGGEIFECTEQGRLLFDVLERLEDLPGPRRPPEEGGRA